MIYIYLLINSLCKLIVLVYLVFLIVFIDNIFICMVIIFFYLVIIFENVFRFI